MKKVIVLIFAAAFLAGLFSCEKQPQTLSDYLRLSARSGKPVLVDFYTDW